MALDRENTDINYLFGRAFAYYKKWDELMSKHGGGELIVEPCRKKFINDPSYTIMDLNTRLLEKFFKSRKGQYYEEGLQEIIEASIDKEFEEYKNLNPTYLRGELDQLEAFKNPGFMISMIREHQNLTQKKLADLIGKKQSDISRWENGGVRPRIEMIEKIAKALKVDVEEIIGGQ